MWLTSIFSPKNIPFGFLFPRELQVILFCTYIVFLVTYSHMYIGIYWSCIIAFTSSMIDLLFLSTTPFCCGLYGKVSSLLILSCLQKYLNSLELNSPPVSNLKILIFFHERFSTRALNSLNLSNTSSFFFKKYIQVSRE